MDGEFVSMLPMLTTWVPFGGPAAESVEWTPETPKQKATPGPQDEQAWLVALVRRVGTYLLRAANEEDLQSRLDSLTGSVETPAEVAKFARICSRLSNDSPKQTPSNTADKIGRVPSRLIEQANALRGIGYLSWVRRRDLFETAPYKINQLRPVQIFEHPEIPTEVWDIVLLRYEGELAIMAVIFAIAEKRTSRRWLLEALAKKRLEGERANLRMLASMGLELPQGVLRPEEVLDLAALIKRNTRLVKEERSAAIHGVQEARSQLSSSS